MAKDPERAQHYLSLAAQQGDCQATKELVVGLQDGSLGAFDPQRQAYWQERIDRACASLTAAAKGQAKAQQ